MPEMPFSKSSDPPESAGQLSRREFARRAAFAATTAVVLPSTLLAQETAPKPAASPQNPPQAATALSPQLQAEGELKYQWLIQKYGSRLSEAQKQDIHRLILEGQKPLEAFRAFPLDNADQPAIVLKLVDAAPASTRGDR